MIVDEDYYSNTYFGEAMETGEFNKLNLRAEDDVASMSNKDLSLIETWETEHVKKSICAQIEWYFINGDTYNEQNKGNQKIGKYSTGSGGTSFNSGNKGSLSPRCERYLDNTTLLFRGQC